MASSQRTKLKIFKTEELAYWYFRLNGCLTIVNFVVHPERRGAQRTDVDIMAVRFPFRSELITEPLEDDTNGLRADDKKIRIMLAEVKRSGLCRLNGPWTKPERKNMQLVLRAIGSFPISDVDRISAVLYQDGAYSDSTIDMSLFCIAAEKCPRMAKEKPKVPQLTWDELKEFIYNRFNEYHRQKADHEQWDETGKELLRLATSCDTFEKFQNRVRL